jgi:hypothetical protein
MLTDLVIIWLVQRLFPNGRAYRLPEPGQATLLYADADGNIYVDDEGVAYESYNSPITSGGIFYRLQRALAQSALQAYEDAQAVYGMIFPNDPRFTIEDAHKWYSYLGIYDSGTVPLADMRMAIARKLSFPYVPLERQNINYITAQLQAAGFNVTAYENKFPGALTPGEVMNNTHGRSICGYFQSGQNQAGELDSDGAVTKLRNYLEEDKDAGVDLPLRSLIYISGSPITTTATVPVERKVEFRQLLVRLKAAQMTAVLFVNYD